MSRLLVEKKRINTLHRHSSVFPKNLVFVSSQEFGRRIQIRDVKKISRNLIFSIRIQVFLIILDDNIVEDKRITKNIGKVEKLSLILGRKIMKNKGFGKMI